MWNFRDTNSIYIQFFGDFSLKMFRENLEFWQSSTCSRITIFLNIWKDKKWTLVKKSNCSSWIVKDTGTLPCPDVYKVLSVQSRILDSHNLLEFGLFYESHLLWIPNKERTRCTQRKKLNFKGKFIEIFNGKNCSVEAHSAVFKLLSEISKLLSVFLTLKAY